MAMGEAVGVAAAVALNANVEVSKVDIGKVRSEEGKQVIYDLVKTADVVVDNFRAGVIERLGFGYETLSRINPRIICASGTGFGGTGPLAYKGGQDILLQALSAVMARKPNAEAAPAIFATALCDYTAGMHLAQAVMLALMQREKTGRRQKVSVAMFDSMLAMQMQEVAVWLKDGRELNWGDRPLSGVFPTTDGAIVIVGAFKENPLQLICRALDLPDLSQEAKYADITARSPTSRSCSTCSGRRSPPTRRNTGSAASTSRTFFARRCWSSAKRWTIPKPRSTASSSRWIGATPISVRR